MRLAVLCVFSSAVAFSQVSVGAKGGVRISDDFESAAESRSRPYVVGAAAALDFPRGFGIEIDALYRRTGYTTGWSTALYSASIREAANVWEFPVLFRYRLRVSGVKPYVDAGWAPRIGHGSAISSGFYLSSPGTFTPYFSRYDTEWPTTHGVVAGGGIVIAAGAVELSPEVRYTRWNRRSVSGVFSDGPGYGASRNQLDILLGVSFRFVH